jgi:hypothetical protein
MAVFAKNAGLIRVVAEGDRVGIALTPTRRASRVNPRVEARGQALPLSGGGKEAA